MGQVAPRAVILDLDATVWDSTPWYAQLAGAPRQQAVDEAMTKLRAGRPAARILQSAGYTDAAFARVCRSGEPPLACFDGLLDAITHLHGRKVRLGVATNLPA